MYSDANSLSMLPSPSDRLNPSCGQSKGDDSSLHASCLHFGSHGNGGTLPNKSGTVNDVDLLKYNYYRFNAN